MQQKSKSKSPLKGDYLSIRWKKDPYQKIHVQLLEKKFVFKETPKFEGKYDLRSMNIRKLELNTVSFKEACLHGLNAYQVLLTACDFSDVYMKKGDFEEAQITNTCFKTIKLSNCSFKKTVLDKVTFEDGIVENCDFTGASLVEVTIENAILDNSNFSELQHPETTVFVGTPQSVKNIKIDQQTLDLLPENSFKKAILARENLGV